MPNDQDATSSAKAPPQPRPSAPDSSAADVRLTPFASLRYRDFKLLWAITFFHAASVWVQQLTLGWYAFKLSDSAFITGAVIAVRAVPFLLTSPLAGVLADRMDRRLLMALGSGIAAVSALWFGTMVTLEIDTLWQLFIVSLLGGVAWSVLDPPRFAVVVESVPPSLMTNAISLNSAIQNVTRGLGPAIGGYLIAYAGVNMNFFLQGALYSATIPLILLLSVPARATDTRATSSVLTNLREGFSYVYRHKAILALMLNGLAFFLFFWSFAFGLLPVFNERVLGKDADSLGLLLAASGIGGLLGAMLIASVKPLQGNATALLVTGVAAGASLVVFSLMHVLPLALVLFLLLGLFQQSFMSNNQTLVQMLAPRQYRGRVMSIFLINFGFSPIGSLAAGALGDLIGSDWAMFVGGCGIVASLLAIRVSFPVLGRVRLAGDGRLLE